MKKYTKISTMKLDGGIEEKEYYYNNFLVKREVTSNDGILSMLERYFKIGPFVIKYYNNIGLCLGTQEGFFTSSSTLVSGRYAEEQKVHVSFVVEQ